MATAAPTRAQRRSTKTNKHDGLGVGILAGGGILAGLFLLWETHHVQEGPPGSGCPEYPTGLYETCSVPGNPASCTIWYVDGCKRWGISTPNQLTRCFGSNPTVDTNVSFGDGDTDAYIPTVGAIFDTTPCPNR